MHFVPDLIRIGAPVCSTWQRTCVSRSGRHLANLRLNIWPLLRRGVSHASKGVQTHRIYSVDFDGMRLLTNSRTIGGLVDKRTATDREHDIRDAFIDGLIMNDIHGQNHERLKLMPLADMCDSEEEKQLLESMSGIDDVSGEPIDPSLIVKARQEEMCGFKERGVYHHVQRGVAEADPEGKICRRALGRCEQG